MYKARRSPSVLEYGLRIDETSKEIAKYNLGIAITGTDEAIGSLIWVDDVIIADIEEKRFQKNAIHHRQDSTIIPHIIWSTQK